MNNSPSKGYAAVLASLLPIPVGSGVYGLLAGAGLEGFASAILGLGFWVVIVAFFATTIVGIPLHWVLERVGGFHWASFALVGGITGAAIGMWMFPEGAKVGLMFGAVGTWAASAYWYGASRKSANKSLQGDAAKPRA